MKGNNKFWLWIAALFLPLAIVAAAPGESRAAFDAFLKIDGIPGDSADLNHVGWAVLTGFWGLGIGPSGVGAGYTHPKTLFYIFKPIDKMTPKLQQAVLDGSYLSGNAPVLIEVVRREGNRPLVLRIELFKVTISEGAIGSKGTGGPSPNVAPGPTDFQANSIDTLNFPFKLFGPGDNLANVTETLTFAFRQIRWTFFLYNPQTGAPAGTVQGGFNLDANLPFVH